MEPNPHPELGPPPPGRPELWGLEALADDIATYKAHQVEWAKEHEGEYVLIREGKLIGFSPSFSKAVRVGNHRLGLVPFLVREVREVDPVIYIPNVVPCTNTATGPASELTGADHDRH